MIFYSLLIIVFLSPLPFGSNVDWAWSLAALLTAVLGVSWSGLYLFKKTTVPFFRHAGSIADVIGIFFLVVGWILIQASSLFPDLNHPLWQLKNELLGYSPGFISLTPDDTLISLMRLISYALVFWLSLCYCKDVNNARRVFYGLMLVGFIYSGYALIMFLGDFKMILWREKKYYLDDLTGTFVNRNHFATFAGFALLCTLALINNIVISSAKYNRGGNLGLQRFIEALIIRTWFPLLSFIIIATALFLTHSRGGFFSTLFALLVLIILLGSNRHTKNSYITGFVIIFLIVASSVFYTSSDGLVARLDAIGLDDEGRDIMRELTWSAIITNPWTGFGLGSFKQAFTLYKSMDLAGTINNATLIDFAHNTYIETIFELGFPAAIALFYCLVRLAMVCFIGLLIRKKDWIYPATGFAASCLIAVHSYVEFSIQMPAIAYTYALLMGAACAQSYSSQKK